MLINNSSPVRATSNSMLVEKLFQRDSALRERQRQSQFDFFRLIGIDLSLLSSGSFGGAAWFWWM